jgi:hypothetical protein
MTALTCTNLDNDEPGVVLLLERVEPGLVVGLLLVVASR